MQSFPQPASTHQDETALSDAAQDLAVMVLRQALDLSAQIEARQKLRAKTRAVSHDPRHDVQRDKAALQAELDRHLHPARPAVSPFRRDQAA